jgi:ketosteroid isomerase-like protein
MRSAFVLVLGLTIVGCTNVKPAPDTAAVRTVILTQNRELADCWSASEAECVAAQFTQDGWQMMPNAQAQAGAEAIERFWQQAFGWGAWEVALESGMLEQSGPLAVERGKYSIRFTANASAPPSRPSTQDRGHYIVYWRLTSDGRWKMAAQALVSEMPARVIAVTNALPSSDPEEIR